jgi:hypothetical protein
MGYRDEVPDGWALWWVLLWAGIAAVLVGYAFSAPFNRWAVAATVAFGIPEAFALLKKADAYPPLTHVTRHYLPKWLAFALIYGLVGTIGSFWFGAQHPTRLGALAALLGWLTAHFDSVYSE